MYYRTFRGSFYVLYGALTIGLILTSVLAPIEYREVEGYELYVYGVRVVYDVPPTVITAAPTASVNTTTLAPTDTNSTNSTNSTDNTTRTTTDTASFSLLDQERISQNWLYQFGELRSDGATALADGSSLDAHNASSSSADSGSSTVEKVRQITYLHHMPVSKLRSVMIAYLFFAAASLLASLVVIIVGFMNVLPPTRFTFLSRHSYIVFIVCMLLVTLTFAMAAVCVSQNAMYKVIGDDYYSQTQLVEKTYYRKAKSGFSCTVAAVGVGIMMIISIGVSLTRAI